MKLHWGMGGRGVKPTTLPDTSVASEAQNQSIKEVLGKETALLNILKVHSRSKWIYNTESMTYRFKSIKDENNKTIKLLQY